MPLKTFQDEPTQMNLTPMLDVVFNLIIFFMVATRFAQFERKIDVQVPRVAAAGALNPAPARRIINVYQDGQVTLDGQTVTLDQLTAGLAATSKQSGDAGVVVRGDGQGTFQNIAAVLNACRQAGVSDLGISVRLAEKSKGPAR
jgi:biopolymer transport protein ExbD